MMTPSRNLNHADVAPGVSQSFGPIELGTVGWEGDQGDHFDMDTSPSDGTTLVKVQLRRGRDHSVPLNPGQAQGNQILARLSGSSGWMIPPAGSEVLVAFPAGFESTPGAPVIFAVLGSSPSIQFQKNRAVLDFGDQAVVIRGKRITLQNNDGDFISLSPEGGIQLTTKEGDNLAIPPGRVQASAQVGGAAGVPGDSRSVLLLSGSSVELQQKTPDNKLVAVVCKNGVTILGPACSIATGTVALGAYASPATPAVGGVTGISGVGSTSVFIQP